MDDNARYSDDDETESFVRELDKDGDGHIVYNEVEQRLDLAHDEITPDAKPHNLHRDSKDDETRHHFLRSIIGSHAQRIPRAGFASRVREWKGSSIMFVARVVSMQTTFGAWQLVKYVTGIEYRATFGRGVVLAKTCAGLPGWSGIVTLGLSYILSLLNLPQVRKRNYESFQLGHLFIYPIITLLCAHGTPALLQWPMLESFLAFPMLLVLAERLTRVAVGFHRILATFTMLYDQTLQIKTTIPTERIWKYQAGQYVFLQVPKLSFFQWHPFAVSVCVGREMRDVGHGQVDIGINGPFGAPAQRFYHFDQAIIIGAGIGVTPSSGILMDLQTKDNQLHGGPGTLGELPTGPGETSLSAAPSQGGDSP
ncbi:nadph oxidase 4 [Seiridium cupressi]